VNGSKFYGLRVKVQGSGVESLGFRVGGLDLGAEG
jgi:hypothetical protein